MNAWTKLKGLIKRGRVSLPGQDGLSFPQNQITSRGVADNAENMEMYGFHYSAPANSLSVVFAVEGHAEAKLAMSYEPFIRPKNIKPGEIVLGNFVAGTTAYFDEDGNLMVNVEGDQTIVVTGDATVNIAGNVTVDVTGNLNATVGGTAGVESTGDMTLKAPNIKLDGIVQITGNAQLDSDLTVTGATALSSTVTSNSKDISDTHKHSGVQVGGSNTGNPI